MRKSAYIAPSTITMDVATEGIMEVISIPVNTGGGITPGESEAKQGWFDDWDEDDNLWDMSTGGGHLLDDRLDNDW